MKRNKNAAVMNKRRSCITFLLELTIIAGFGPNEIKANTRLTTLPRGDFAIIRFRESNHCPRS